MIPRNSCGYKNEMPKSFEFYLGMPSLSESKASVTRTFPYLCATVHDRASIFIITRSAHPNLITPTRFRVEISY